MSVSPFRPCPEGYRRLAIHANMPAKLFSEMVRWMAANESFRLIGHKGFLVEATDYEYFAGIADRRGPVAAEQNFEIETNADDEDVVWFRMRFL